MQFTDYLDVLKYNKQTGQPDLSLQAGIGGIVEELAELIAEPLLIGADSTKLNNIVKELGDITWRLAQAWVDGLQLPWPAILRLSRDFDVSSTVDWALEADIGHNSYNGSFVSAHLRDSDNCTIEVVDAKLRHIFTILQQRYAIPSLSLINKIVFQGHSLDTIDKKSNDAYSRILRDNLEEIALHLFDTCILLSGKYGYCFEPHFILSLNQTKLDSRYPSGTFTTADSIKRVDQQSTTAEYISEAIAPAAHTVTNNLLLETMAKAGYMPIYDSTDSGQPTRFIPTPTSVIPKHAPPPPPTPLSPKQKVIWLTTTYPSLPIKFLKALLHLPESDDLTTMSADFTATQHREWQHYQSNIDTLFSGSPKPTVTTADIGWLAATYPSLPTNFLKALLHLPGSDELTTMSADFTVTQHREWQHYQNNMDTLFIGSPKPTVTTAEIGLVVSSALP